MDIADDIAYSTYDLEDTFKSGFLEPLKILGSSQDIIARVARKVKKDLGRRVSSEGVIGNLFEIFTNAGLVDDIESSPKAEIDTPSGKLFQAVEIDKASSKLASNGYMRTQFTADLVSEFLAAVDVRINEECPQLSQVYLRKSALKKVLCLKHFTFEATIMSPRLRISERRGYDIVKNLFEELDTEKGYLLMPEDFRKLYRLFKDDAMRKRVVSDFIAGMTDRYAVEFYGRIFSESPQSIFKPF